MRQSLQLSCSLDLLDGSHLRWGKGVLLGEQCAGRIGRQMRPIAMVRRIWWLHRCCCSSLTTLISAKHWAVPKHLCFAAGARGGPTVWLAIATWTIGAGVHMPTMK